MSALWLLFNGVCKDFILMMMQLTGWKEQWWKHLWNEKWNYSICKTVESKKVVQMEQLSSVGVCADNDFWTNKQIWIFGMLVHC